MRYRPSRGLLAILVLGITFFYPLLAPVPHRIDEAHFKLIQRGMSLAQVEAIFGALPGEYDWAEADRDPMWGTEVSLDALHHEYILRQVLVGWANPMLPHEMLLPTKSWSSRSGFFEIVFDENGRVLWPNHWPPVRVLSPWQRAWRWFKTK